MFNRRSQLLVHSLTVLLKVCDAYCCLVAMIRELMYGLGGVVITESDDDAKSEADAALGVGIAALALAVLLLLAAIYYFYDRSGKDDSAALLK
jgi:hypothetical protein